LVCEKKSSRFEFDIILDLINFSPKIQDEKSGMASPIQGIDLKVVRKALREQRRKMAEEGVVWLSEHPLSCPQFTRADFNIRLVQGQHAKRIVKLRTMKEVQMAQVKDSVPSPLKDLQQSPSTTSSEDDRCELLLEREHGDAEGHSAGANTDEHSGR
jgi:hypothetical protein